MRTMSFFITVFIAGAALTLLGAISGFVWPRLLWVRNRALLLRIFVGFALTYAASLLVCILSGPEFIRGPDFKPVPVSIYYSAFELSMLLLFIFMPFTLWAGALLQGGERNERIIAILFMAAWVGVSLWFWHAGGRDLQCLNEGDTESFSRQGCIIFSGFAGFAVSFVLIFVPWFTYKFWQRIKNK